MKSCEEQLKISLEWLSCETEVALAASIYFFSKFFLLSMILEKSSSALISGRVWLVNCVTSVGLLAHHLPVSSWWLKEAAAFSVSCFFFFHWEIQELSQVLRLFPSAPSDSLIWNSFTCLRGTRKDKRSESFSLLPSRSPIVGLLL